MMRSGCAVAAPVVELLPVADDEDVRLHDRGLALVRLVEEHVQRGDARLARLSAKRGQERCPKGEDNALVLIRGRGEQVRRALQDLHALVLRQCQVLREGKGLVRVFLGHGHVGHLLCGVIWSFRCSVPVTQFFRG